MVVCLLTLFILFSIWHYNLNRLTTICELNVFKILVIEIEKRKNLNWEDKLIDGLIYFVKPKAHNELSKRPVKETKYKHWEMGNFIILFSDDWANAILLKNQTFIQKFKHNISIRITCLKTHEVYDFFLVFT